MKLGETSYILLSKLLVRENCKGSPKGHAWPLGKGQLEAKVICVKIIASHSFFLKLLTQKLGFI